MTITGNYRVGVLIPREGGDFDSHLAPTQRDDFEHPVIVGYHTSSGFGFGMLIEHIRTGPYGNERNPAGERLFSAFWGNDPATITEDDWGEPKVIYGPVGLIGLSHNQPVDFSEEHERMVAPILTNYLEELKLEMMGRQL